MKFIKGNAIAHATRYELYKKVDDSSYEKIGTQYIGNKQYNNRGYFNAIGALTEGTASTSNYVYTDIIDITRLVDYVVDESAPDYKVCAQVLTGDEDQVAAVFYSSTDRASKVYYMTYNEVIGAGGFNAATIQSIAQEHNAGYVSFSSYAGNVDYIDVCFDDGIFFCLDDYTEVLTSGDVLVVVAVGEGDADTDGDGIIYTDSDYSNEIIYTTTDEPEDETIVGTWIFNENISVNGSAWYSVNFTSNGVSYIAFSDRNSQTADIHDMSLRYFKTSTTYDTAFGADGSWRNEAYRTVTISEEPTDEEFVTWLKANATKQDVNTPSLISFNLHGTERQAEKGMEWVTWVTSKYNTVGVYIEGIALYYIDGTRIYQHTQDTNNITIYGSDIIVENGSYSSFISESGGSN